jgi:hypothetical protein
MCVGGEAPLWARQDLQCQHSSGADGGQHLVEPVGAGKEAGHAGPNIQQSASKQSQLLLLLLPMLLLLLLEVGDELGGCCYEGRGEVYGSKAETGTRDAQTFMQHTVEVIGSERRGHAWVACSVLKAAEAECTT